MLYWYQATSSVIGITGTSDSMTFSNWLTIWCCSAVLVVPAYSLKSLSVAGLE